jgi:hypothetical protein
MKTNHKGNLMQQIDLKLSLDDVNTILEALGQMPYIRVYQLIAKLQQQAEPQVQGEPASLANGAVGKKGAEQ